MRHPLPFAIAVFLGVVLDQLSKSLVFWLVKPGESVSAIGGLFHITSVYNRGVAFSLFKEYPWLVLAFSCVAVPALAYWYARTWRQAPAVQVWSQGLLLAGAIGNLIDRILPPFMVRDFIEFVPQVPIVGKWGIFNVADICICVGVALYLLGELRRAPAESTPPTPPSKGGENHSSPPSSTVKERG